MMVLGDGIKGTAHPAGPPLSYAFKAFYVKDIPAIYVPYSLPRLP